MKIKSLIVDDNPFIIDLLSDQLNQEHPNVEIIGSAQSGQEALEKIKSLRPDLVFLDVEMPDMSGFDMLAYLDEIFFQTIFITSFSHYAIKAIRFNALDYLVKPINPKELAQALKRYAENPANPQRVKEALENLKTEKNEDQTFFLPTQEGGLKLVLKNIVRIEGERNYSYIYLSDNTKKLSSKTLGYFEEILSDKGFFRCHRSHLVNGFHVEKISEQSFIILDNKMELPISRRKRKETQNWLEEYRNK